MLRNRWTPVLVVVALLALLAAALHLAGGPRWLEDRLLALHGIHRAAPHGDSRHAS